MNGKRQFALGVLVLVFGASLMARPLARGNYAQQFRNSPNAQPSLHFPLGTDDLGRDRLSRLLYGTRLSLVLAPLAALLATAVAGVVGGFAGFLGGAWERIALSVIDLSLSLPWLFLLVTARAILPLNVPPLASVIITFGLLGFLGWAWSARVVCAGARALRGSEFAMQAAACGCPKLRLFLVHVLPNLRPTLCAQFWISIPVFILAEANLGVLGLGVAEPLPSWGSLLRELTSYQGFLSQPWVLAPLVLLAGVLACFQILLGAEDFHT